jgi:hypothetical protein
MAVRRSLRWPLVFALQPSTTQLLDHADYVYDLQRDINAPGELVVRRFFDDALGRDVAGLRGFHWHTTPADLSGAIVDEMFVYMSLRMRTVAYVAGERLAMSVDRCSLPLGRQMLQVMDTTPREDGGCRFRWRIAVRYLPGMAPLAPMVTPLFRRMFEQSLDSVERHFAAAAPPALPDRDRGAAASIDSRTIRPDRRAF